MRTRIARAVALVAVASMPLLAGCGAGSATSGGTAAPASAPAPDVAVSVSPSPPSTASTSAVAPAQQKKQVQAATQKFVKTVLTIGYPDKSFDAYTERIQPLMTQEGFDSLESADSIKQGSTALKSLYAQRARSAPKFSVDPQVTALEETSATAELPYENLAQQKSGDGWKTLKSLGKGSVTVKLVLVEGKWLVDNAS